MKSTTSSNILTWLDSIFAIFESNLTTLSILNLTSFKLHSNRWESLQSISQEYKPQVNVFPERFNKAFLNYV